MFRKGDHVQERRVRRNEDRPLRHLLVTGGCGFIGSNFINHFVPTHPAVHVYNVDKMNYCANARSIEVAASPRYHFIKGDIKDRDLVMHLLQSYDIDTIIHFAAQTHVDNSFGNSLAFTMNNVYGTHVLLECARVYGKIEKFVHISTDEVYGEVTDSQGEDSTLNPTNPYAATKAAAEYIVKSYHISFNLPVLITRSNNVYGPYQYPEKVIPRFITLALRNERLTIHGTGAVRRTFVFSRDAARALELLIDRGIIGEVYNIGSEDEFSVLELAEKTIRAVRGEDNEAGQAAAAAAAGPDALRAQTMVFVKDRDFNDERYKVDSAKLEELGWRREVSFDVGFAQTVAWYRQAILHDHFWPSLEADMTKDEESYSA